MEKRHSDDSGLWDELCKKQLDFLHSDDSEQPGHTPSLSTVFAGCMKKA